MHYLIFPRPSFYIIPVECNYLALIITSGAYQNYLVKLESYIQILLKTVSRALEQEACWQWCSGPDEAVVSRAGITVVRMSSIQD